MLEHASESYSTASSRDNRSWHGLAAREGRCGVVYQEATPRAVAHPIVHCSPLIWPHHVRSCIISALETRPACSSLVKDLGDHASSWVERRGWQRHIMSMQHASWKAASRVQAHVQRPQQRRAHVGRAPRLLLRPLARGPRGAPTPYANLRLLSVLHLPGTSWQSRGETPQRPCLALWQCSIARAVGLPLGSSTTQRPRGRGRGATLEKRGDRDAKRAVRVRVCA
jgi:hypothetical protein